MCDVLIEHSGLQEQLAGALFSEAEIRPLLQKYIFIPRLQILEKRGNNASVCSHSFEFSGDRTELTIAGNGVTIIEGDFLKADATVSGISTNLDPLRALILEIKHPFEVSLKAGEIVIKGHGILKTAVTEVVPTDEFAGIANWSDIMVLNARRYQQLPGETVSGILILILGSFGSAVLGRFLRKRIIT
jgi:hypothetical protein